MNDYYRAGLLGLAVVAVVVSVPRVDIVRSDPVYVEKSAVMVGTATGHGSGVHIGNGRVLTAAHVVDDATGIKVGGDPANVLWSGKQYDVALLQTTVKGAAPRLACRTAAVGEQAEAVGNPGPLRDMHSFGKISGGEQSRGPWASTIIVNFAIAPGMSGGPVYDAAGDIIGLVVGVAAVPNGFGASFVSFGYVVPSSAVCKLLGRAT